MDAGGADDRLGEVLASTQHIHKQCRGTDLVVGCEPAISACWDATFYRECLSLNTDRDGCKGREVTGSYCSLICFHSSKANIMLGFLFSLQFWSVTCAAWVVLRVINPFCFPALCLATLTYGNRDASELVVCGMSSCCATLNFSIWEGFGSWAVFNSWDDEEAEGHWQQGLAEGIRNMCYEKAREVLSYIRGLWAWVCCWLYAWLLTNLSDSLFAVSFLCVSFWGKGFSCVSL